MNQNRGPDFKRMTSRLDFSPDEKAKMREKAKSTTKRFRDRMSSDEKVKMREKDTIGRKRLRLAKNDIPTIIYHKMISNQ